MLNFPNTIRWIITDFDGILTDNYVYINDDYSMTRRINFKDVIGLNSLYKSGIEIGIISGEANPAIDIIANKFQIKEVHTKISNKIQVLKSIIDKYSLTQEEYLYIGDDINDAECLNYAKYKVTVPAAVKCIKEINGIQITEYEGGSGAFREVADCLVS